MKQRLLLVLLALFTSIGWMKATITVTVSQGSKGTLSWTKSTNAGAIPVTLSVDGKDVTVSGTSISVENYVKDKSAKFVLDGSVSRFNVNGAKVEDAFSVDGHTTLTYLEINGANGSRLTSVNLDATDEAKLSTLKINNCGLTKLPNYLSANLVDKATVDLQNNELSDVSSLVVNRELTYKLGGNKINQWPKMESAKATLEYGSQSSLEISRTASQANDWFDIWSGKGTADNSISYLYSNLGITVNDLNFAWRKGTEGSFSSSLIKKNDTYPSNFQFFSGNAYQSGTYQCQISPKSGVAGPTYIVTVDVQPAKFELKITADPMEGAQSFEIANGTTKGTLTDNNPLPVKKGDQLTFSAKAKDDYTFSNYKVEGLTKVSENVYEVVGLGFDEKELTATAVFTNKTYKLTIDSNAEFGSYTVTNQATNKEVENGDLIPYGTKLTVKATPKEGYTPRVILNKVESKGTKDNEGVYTFSDLEIKKASTLEIFFEAAKEYSLSVQILGGYNLKLNGNTAYTKNSANHKGYYVDKNDHLPKFQAGTKINLEMTEGTTKIKKILLNGSFVSSSSTAQFDMPASDSYITFETAELAEITVTGKDLEDDNKTQKYTYDGEPHAFQYTVTPTGLTGFTVKYSKVGLVDNYQETVPKAVGKYNVLITRNADNSYAKCKKEGFILEIEEATPSITKAPTVNVTSDGDYSISNGVAQVGGKNVTGEWTVVKVANGIATAITKPGGDDAKESHIATVAFIPSDQNNLLGEKNASTQVVTNAATVEVPVKVGNTALATYKVTATNIPSDMSLTFWNGDLEVKSGESVAKGTKLTIKLTYPAGYTNVHIKENKGTERKSGEGKDGSVVWEYETSKDSGNGLEAALDVTVIYDGSASVYTPVIEFIKSAECPVKYTYTGNVEMDKLFDYNNFKLKAGSFFKEISVDDEGTLKEKMTITYKDANGKAVVAPINAGEYTVVVSIPDLKTDNGTYKAVSQEFEKLYIIEKAEVKVTEWPTGAVVGVGKDAKTAQFIGGAANVEGAFHFIEEDKIGVPETGEEYLVKFVPKDSNNYKEVLTAADGKNKVKVVVTDQRTLFISDVTNGTVVVTDQNGNALKNEQTLNSSITSIKVTATPASGYALGSIRVNNSTLSNGGSYTVGSDNVVVSVTFVRQYTITLGSAPRGVKIATRPSSNIVVAGGSYTFTLNHLSGDKPTVTGASNISVSTSGSTTTVRVTNIQANATLAIALANPTAIKITTKETLSKAGKPMGTIRVSGVNSSNECYYGDKITVTATANPGVDFAGWESMTSTENPYEFEATNATYIFQAKYHGVLTGIESVDELNYYGGDGYIFVNCPAQGTLTIISMNGRAQKMSVSGQTRVTVPAGVYGIVLTSGSEVVRDKVVVR